MGGINPINIPLISDLDKSISKNYGVLYSDSISLRAFYIIDDKGIIRQSTINDLQIGRSVDEALRLVQAIQFFEKNGEVCPANWTPGKSTVMYIFILDETGPHWLEKVLL